MSDIPKCEYDQGYAGKCHLHADFAEPIALCRKHAASKCTGCKAQAIKDCDYEGQLVCTYPLCANCHHVGSGMWDCRHEPKPEGG